MLPEQPHGAVAIGIHLVHEWVGILGQACCEDDHFVVLRHDPEEIIDTRPLLNIYLAGISVNVDGNDIVWVLDLVELAVHESFVQVQDQRFHSSASFGLWTQ